ncbi:MAG: SpoIIE family protein phosphatase [Candidatus Baltobacteraceae bacterium]
MHPRVRTQAYLVSALPLLFLLGVFGLALLVQQTSLRGSEYEQRSQTIVARDDRVHELLNQASRAAVSYAGSNDLKKIAALEDAHRAMPAALDQLQSAAGAEPGMTARVRRLRGLVAGGFEVLERYTRALRSGHPQTARAISNARATRALSVQLAAAQSDFTSAQRSFELSQIGALRAGILRYEYALIFTCVAGILLTLMVSGRFGIGIAERLQRLAENAERAALGQTVVPLGGNDEFADLDKVYQAMTARIAREHHIASTLQRVLLPQTLPKMEGVRIDSAYTPAAEDAEVGGDWYDVFAISDRTLCISVGDVAGHGLRAAALMAGARLAVRAAARIDPSPAAVLANLNRVLCADEPETVVTAFVATFDVATGALTYGMAGHPPPLTISPDGETAFLEGRGFMLGADVRASFDEYSTELREGWALVVYTDGVIEINRDYFDGQARLTQASRAEFFEPSDNIAEAIQNRVLRNARPHDDAALLFIGVTKLGALSTAPAGRVWTLDAREESSSRRVKRALLWHLGELVAPQSDLSAVELILGELIGNVARHTPGPAEVALDYDNGQAILRVSDSGGPFEFSNSGADLLSESGRGLFLVRTMSNGFKIEHDGTGNRVSAVLPVSLA